MKSITDYYTKEDVIELANKGDFLPSTGDLYNNKTLDGSNVRQWLEDRGFIVIRNYDTGRNGLAITSCGIKVSTNGYCSMI